MPAAAQTMHASAAARGAAGVLLLGPPGAGKSDMVLRLLHHGFVLIADDRVMIEGRHAAPPPALAGLLEVRGLGIVHLPYVTADLVLTVRLARGDRLPDPAPRQAPGQAPGQARLSETSDLSGLDLPVIDIDPTAASAPLRIAMALDCLQGKVAMRVGALA